MAHRKRSPIKRPLSRGKIYPEQEKIIFLNSLLQSYRHLHHCRNFFRVSVPVITAPVTHQDQGHERMIDKNKSWKLSIAPERRFS
jgi:hypothetical protein